MTVTRWCHRANEIAFAYTGQRDSCILTSHALADVLRRNGFQAEVFRADVAIHCTDHRCTGCIAGGDGDGTRRKASPGMWLGHLAVECGDHILDPTIDQLVTGCGRTPAPFVAEKPPGWDQGEPIRYERGGLMIRHRRYRRQNGWVSKPDARQCRWKPLADLIIAAE